MQRIAEIMAQKAKKLLASGEVRRVLGWERDELFGAAPTFFGSQERLAGFVYDETCGANLSKYLIAAGKKDGRTLVFLKPCDTYSLNQLVTEHRVPREKVVAVGVPCHGMRDVRGEMLERCEVCQKKHVGCDEVLADPEPAPREKANRFEGVEAIEAMTPEARFEFWRGELSRCIRCNACRNACPACSCVQCVFDNPASGVAGKASADDFEENLFHNIRAFHVAGRCTDCGECARACPQHIPLQLLNRKIIKDLGALYGEYQAGEKVGLRSPLTDYAEGDAEPGDFVERGGAGC